MSAEEVGGVVLALSARGYVEREVAHDGRADVEVDAVQFEAIDRGRHSDALVAIHKRVVHCQMKQVGGRHPGEAVVCELPAERGLGLGERGLQQAYVADTMAAAVSVDLVIVEA